MKKIMTSPIVIPAILLFFGILAFLYSLYCLSFFAWITATPVKQKVLEQAKEYAIMWGNISLISIAFILVSSFYLYWKFKEKNNITRR